MDTLLILVHVSMFGRFKRFNEARLVKIAHVHSLNVFGATKINKQLTEKVQYVRSLDISLNICLAWCRDSVFW